MNEVEKHYTVDEVAALLGVSPRTVWNYVAEGERTQGKEGIYPIVKLSFKVVRFPARSVNKFLKSRTVAAEPVEAAAE